MSRVLTAETIAEIREAFASSDLVLGAGVGRVDGPRCTIAEINLILTGELTDHPHPCISDVIRQWVMRVQDDMPSALRNAPAWREAAVGIAGSAAGRAVERGRRALILDWMWDALADEALLKVVPADNRPSWDAMLRDRTSAAADTAFIECFVAGFIAEVASRAAIAVSSPERVGTSVADAAAAVDAAASAAYTANAAGPGARTDFWERRDPAGLLTRMIELAD